MITYSILYNLVYYAYMFLFNFKHFQFRVSNVKLIDAHKDYATNWRDRQCNTYVFIPICRSKIISNL